MTPPDAALWAEAIRAEIEAHVAAHPPPSGRAVLLVQHTDWSHATRGRADKATPGGALFEWTTDTLAAWMLAVGVSEGMVSPATVRRVRETAAAGIPQALVMAGGLVLLPLHGDPLTFAPVVVPPAN